MSVQLAHPGDDRLAGLLVGSDLEGRVLLGQTLDRRAELLLILLGPGLDRHVDDRRGEAHRLEDDRCLQAAERVAGGGVLQPHHRNDLAGRRPVDLLPLVGMHPVDLADPLRCDLVLLSTWEPARSVPE